MTGRPPIDTSNLVGTKINMLTITAHLGMVNNIRMVKAICECGIEKEYILGNIIGKGKTKSCGCFNKKVTAERNKSYTTHGLTGHPLLGVWHGMKSRCYDEKDSHFKSYGALGVTICDEWLKDVLVFYNWAMGNGWKRGLQIDKDKLSPFKTGKIYSPEFCCFLTPNENALYKSNSIMIEYNGETKGLAEWAILLKMPHTLLESRYQAGWDTVRMFETQNTKDRLIEFNNESKCLRDWCKKFKIAYGTVHSRIKYLGWDIERALTSPLVPTNQSGVHKKYTT